MRDLPCAGPEGFIRPVPEIQRAFGIFAEIYKRMDRLAGAGKLQCSYWETDSCIFVVRLAAHVSNG